MAGVAIVPGVTFIAGVASFPLVAPPPSALGLLAQDPDA